MASRAPGRCPDRVGPGRSGRLSTRSRLLGGKPRSGRAVLATTATGLPRLFRIMARMRRDGARVYLRRLSPRPPPLPARETRRRSRRVGRPWISCRTTTPRYSAALAGVDGARVRSIERRGGVKKLEAPGNGIGGSEAKVAARKQRGRHRACALPSHLSTAPDAQRFLLRHGVGACLCGIGSLPRCRAGGITLGVLRSRGCALPFPQRLGQFVIVEAPWYFHLFYRAISPFIDKAPRPNPPRPFPFKLSTRPARHAAKAPQTSRKQTPPGGRGLQRRDRGGIFRA